MTVYAVEQYLGGCIAIFSSHGLAESYINREFPGQREAFVIVSYIVDINTEGQIDIDKT